MFDALDGEAVTVGGEAETVVERKGVGLGAEEDEGGAGGVGGGEEKRHDGTPDAATAVGGEGGDPGDLGFAALAVVEDEAASADGSGTVGGEKEGEGVDAALVVGIGDGGGDALLIAEDAATEVQDGRVLGLGADLAHLDVIKLDLGWCIGELRELSHGYPVPLAPFEPGRCMTEAIAA